MESPWRGTGVFPGGGQRALPKPMCPPYQLERRWVPKHTHRFQAACGRYGISSGRAGRDRNTHISPFSVTPENQCAWVRNSGSKHQKEDHTTRLSPSSFRPVSLRNATIEGHTPTILATTSMSSGIARLLVKMAFFSAGREAIQSRLSAPFNLFTINSVMEYGSRVPKTLDAVFWRQRLKRRNSNNGYSINFCWYPLPRKLTYASTRAWGPPCTDTTWTSGPIASMIRLVQPPPRSRSHWNDPALPRTPDGTDCCPNNEGTPRCARPPPWTQPRNIHATVPTWRPSSEFAGTYHWGLLTKSNTTMKIRDESLLCDKESH